MPAEVRPSRRVVEQRVRNNAIESLEYLASFEHQKEYAKSVPFVHIPRELLADWADHFAHQVGPDLEFPDV